MNINIHKTGLIIAISILVCLTGWTSWDLYQDLKQRSLYSQQQQNKGCIKQTKMGRDRHGIFEYQIWKCPNDTNEYDITDNVIIK